MISVIVPVYREPNLIEWLNTSFSMISGIEVLVVDGDAENPSVKAPHLPEWCQYLTSEPGRGNQMNRGASLARGDVLMFCHADTVLPQDWPELIRYGLKDPAIGAGAFSLKFDSSLKWFRVLAWCANMRSKLSRIPFGDQSMFVRRDVFELMCGYESVPIMEDVSFMKKLRHYHIKIILLSETVETSIRRWERYGIIYATFMNQWFQLLFFLGLSPHWIYKHYYKRR